MYSTDFNQGNLRKFNLNTGFEFCHVAKLGHASMATKKYKPSLLYLKVELSNYFFI